MYVYICVYMLNRGCAESTNILENTRTMNTNWLIRQMAWQMPYHLEHHGCFYFFFSFTCCFCDPFAHLSDALPPPPRSLTPPPLPSRALPPSCCEMQRGHTCPSTSYQRQTSWWWRVAAGPRNHVSHVPAPLFLPPACPSHSLPALASRNAHVMSM